MSKITMLILAIIVGVLPVQVQFQYFKSSNLPLPRGYKVWDLDVDKLEIDPNVVFYKESRISETQEINFYWVNNSVVYIEHYWYDMSSGSGRQVDQFLSQYFLTRYGYIRANRKVNTTISQVDNDYLESAKKVWRQYVVELYHLMDYHINVLEIFTRLHN